ncbi:hypothetical protein [Conyzicola sp.]|uniref:hypothetical protein n=1 Tax=Conyzicola sp. TaxID=1969404 RepID=UPI003988EECA
MPESVAAYDSWVEVLAALEESAASALDPGSMTDAAAPATWTPPAGLGPLPLPLRERAQTLLADQRGAARALDELQRETGRHLAAVRAVPQLSDRQSVYLDVTG